MLVSVGYCWLVCMSCVVGWFELVSELVVDCIHCALLFVGVGWDQAYLVSFNCINTTTQPQQLV